MNELSDVRALHKIESFDTKGNFLEIMPKLYNYIVDSELAENPHTAPSDVTTIIRSLYLSEDTMGQTITTSMRYRIDL